MKSAIRLLLSTFGALTGLTGVEHGLGEVLQGSVAPGGLMIQSWPESKFFSILSGEPAMTVVPNLLVTGLLACLFSLAYILCVVWRVDRKHSGLLLMLIALLMLLCGGGIFPPVFALLIGAAVTRLRPQASRRAASSIGGCRFLARLWPWSFGACLFCWLGMVPGVPMLNYFFGVNNDALLLILLAGMFGFLILAGAAAWAHDVETPAGSLPAEAARPAQAAGWPVA